MTYELEHVISYGSVDTPFRDEPYAIRDGRIEVETYSEACELVSRFSCDWIDGDPHPDREPEPVDEPPDDELADFDPETDKPQSSSRQTIKATYDRLKAEGLDDAAEQIRRPGLYPRDLPMGGNPQYKVARRLARKHLPGWVPPGRLRW